MKKWIKAHSKILISILGIVFIANAVYGLIIATESWQFVINSITLFCWILYFFGLLEYLAKYMNGGTRIKQV